MILPNCCQQHVELSKYKTNPSLGSPKCVHVLVDPSNDLDVSAYTVPPQQRVWWLVELVDDSTKQEYLDCRWKFLSSLTMQNELAKSWKEIPANTDT